MTHGEPVTAIGSGLLRIVADRGTQDITPSDVVDTAPLSIALGKDAYLIAADCLAGDDQLVCAASTGDG